MMRATPSFPPLEWIDISRPLGPHTPVWPGDLPVSLDTERWTNDASRTIEVRAARLSLHAGTHMDAPRHMLPAGASIAGFPLDGCLQPCRVVAAAGGAITTADLRDAGGAEAVLVRTRSLPPTAEFRPDFTAFEPAAARTLVSRGVRLVGIDAPSADPFDSVVLPAHHIFFEAGVFILENLRLDHVAPGRYLLLMVPLPWTDAEASPVRPLLAPWPIPDSG
jgi:arylformamidase